MKGASLFKNSNSLHLSLEFHPHVKITKKRGKGAHFLLMVKKENRKMEDGL